MVHKVRPRCINPACSGISSSGVGSDTERFAFNESDVSAGVGDTDGVLFFSDPGFPEGSLYSYYENADANDAPGIKISRTGMYLVQVSISEAGDGKIGVGYDPSSFASTFVVTSDGIYAFAPVDAADSNETALFICAIIPVGSTAAADDDLGVVYLMGIDSETTIDVGIQRIGDFSGSGAAPSGDDDGPPPDEVPVIPT